MFRDVRIVTRRVGGERRKILLVHLKSPKESKGNTNALTVEIFDTKSKFCPVRAFEDYVRKFVVLSRKNLDLQKNTISSITLNNFYLNDDVSEITPFSSLNMEIWTTSKNTYLDLRGVQ